MPPNPLKGECLRVKLFFLFKKLLLKFLVKKEFELPIYSPLLGG